ncbi:hypothetical protein LSUE1_G003254 [Lachnellula suecica]|uniref:Uncharacterized protein n=1 Tax=Lachnellula suecica TaxID=602035 RepID=A0A8T9C803_9HELO|nr:hypothetical protein LSUE1_G003254 [Lachnellula suecica]
MRGKNQKAVATVPKIKSWINQESQCSQMSSGLYFPLEMQIGSNLPLTQFACDVPPYALDLIFQFFTTLGGAMYPITLCLSFDVKSLMWIEHLAVDPLYCNSVLWMVQSYFDWMRGCGTSHVQMQHASETLNLLQYRLSDNRLAVSEVTISVVMSLVMMNALMGDVAVARKHMLGLWEMVGLRGGVGTFGNGQIRVKVCRADLTVALLTGNKPLFFSEGVSWEPYIAKSQNTPLPPPFAALDSKLSHIWADLREFSRSANLAFQTGQKMDCTLFQEVLVSVQYRLQLLEMVTGPLDEAMQVGMLAFNTDIFLQMQGLEIRFGRLSSRIRDSLLGLNDTFLLTFKLWLLFAAQMCIGFGTEELWLKRDISETLEALCLTSWKATRDILKDYLWIDVLHDGGGRKTFHAAISGS